MTSKTISRGFTEGRLLFGAKTTVVNRFRFTAFDDLGLQISRVPIRPERPTRE